MRPLGVDRWSSPAWTVAAVAPAAHGAKAGHARRTATELDPLAGRRSDRHPHGVPYGAPCGRALESLEPKGAASDG
jgi:hypothetical protein